MKNISAVLISCILMFSTGGMLLSSAEKQELSVFYEGKKVRGVNTLYVEEGFGYLPVKSIEKIYRMTISWKRVSKGVVFSSRGTTVELTIGSDRVVIGDIPYQMNNPTKEIQGTVCAPLTLLLTQSFGEAVRCTTIWNNDTKTLEIDIKGNVQTPHFYTETENTRVVFEYAHYVLVQHEIKKDRVVITFDNGVAGSDVEYPVEDGRIAQIRVKQYRQKAIAEVMLEKKNKTPRVEYLTDPSRIVVIVDGESFEEPAEIMMPAPAPSPIKYTGNKKVVVIDSGHGGKDPGAIGRNGTKEKEVNLKIALRLAKLLEQEGNMRVILTRDTDRFIPLLERTQIANKQKADLFVSVHCNSSLKKTSEGFEIYFLAGSATDKAAEATAQLENSALQLEEDSHDKKKRFEKLLWSIAQNLFHRESADMCAYILNQVKKRVTISRCSGKQARFYVLMNAKMPSILIENGFLSNKHEEAKLKSKRYQAQLVDAYYAGIVDYFSKR